MRTLARSLSLLAVPMLVAGSSAGAVAEGDRSIRASAAEAPTLVRSTATSSWSPPSPDPTGLEYVAASNSLLVSDSEVEETPLYAEANVYRATTGGALLGTSSTTSFSDEPAGVAVNPANGHVFFSDDNVRRVYEVHIGPDGQYGTGDDTVTSFATGPFGSTDLEGLAFGGGKLFIADGKEPEGTSDVYVIDPGPNGAFEGGGDDLVSHWDTLSLGQPNPEGIAYNGDLGTLFIVSNVQKGDVTETTIQGQLVGHIELSFLPTRAPGGLAYGQGSTDPSDRVLYLADRGRDSGPNVNNDGVIYEISLGRKAGSQLFLNARRRAVEPGDRPRLVAQVFPCAGREGDPIDFYRRGKRIAQKASNSACVAKVRVRMRKTSSFRAAQPEVGISNRVRIRVKQRPQN
jgi:hypothetical protein